MSKPMLLSIKDWNVSEIKYMAPKISDKGLKTVSVISKQTNRALHISTPLMMTWGISDYVDDKTGESDGKFTISLNFPSEEYANEQTREFLQKLADFENQILDDATTNSELWLNDSTPREVIKHSFYPILKYRKNKDTKKLDFSSPPSIRVKVPCYNGKWGIEIYDTKNNLIFPCDNPLKTPMDFVSKLSNVACVLNMSQLWFGAKQFGLTLRLVQCMVKPRMVESIYGKCHIQLSVEDRHTMEDSTMVKEEEVAQVYGTTTMEEEEGMVEAKKLTSESSKGMTSKTMVADSDDEGGKMADSAPTPAPKRKLDSEEIPVVPMPTPGGETLPPKKKVVKKVAK